MKKTSEVPISVTKKVALKMFPYPMNHRGIPDRDDIPRVDCDIQPMAYRFRNQTENISLMFNDGH